MNTPPSLRAHSPLTRADFHAAQGVLLVVRNPPPAPPPVKGQPALVAGNPAEGVEILIAVWDDGSVTALNGHVDLGTGIRTALAQIVAEELDVPLAQVNMVLGDTTRAPNQGATIASASIQIHAKPLRTAAAQAHPNAAHHELAELAKRHDLTLVTQNVDNLHERGGSSDVIHMHGELTRALCAACGHRWPSPMETDTTTLCPACGTAAVRPDIVWFGEMPYHMEQIWAAIEQADIFAAIGTSGQVYPAAGFGQHARRSGAHCVELNLDRSAVSRDFHEHLIGPATQIVPEWVARLG